MGLDIVEIVITIEKKFSISMKDEEASKIETVHDLVSYTYHLQQETTEHSIIEVQSEVMDIIHRLIGIPQKEIKLESKLVGDLGID